jgi:hypothetical protein
VVALLERLAVEEGRELREGLGVVVHGARDVLLVGGELVGDLLIELGDESGGGHGFHRNAAEGEPPEPEAGERIRPLDLGHPNVGC